MRRQRRTPAREQTLIVCPICGLSKPHKDPRAIEYHKEQVQANRKAIARFHRKWREKLEQQG